MISADLTSLAQALDQASGIGIDRAAAEVVRDGAYGIQHTAQSKAPKRTGALASSIEVRFEGPLKATIGPTAKYAPFVVYGTRPHPIYPRKPGGVLVFQSHGETVFTKKVNHPGTKANPFMHDATEEVLNEMAKNLGVAAVGIITDAN